MITVLYGDIIEYKGQFYVTDTLGNISWKYNSSLKLVPFFPPLYALGSQKHLVESCGAFYVVDRYFNKERGRVEHTNRYSFAVGKMHPFKSSTPVDGAQSVSPTLI
ncbi:hypothetical protein SO802_024846 [Lithocarpus litseifolius]|uniref:KIB1-4 beta-propeller domain-containing protein n=1 Tax=Lithocarpus litseifolius TaxID=425828 RepID=A0AAW2CBT6_9ROSI